MFGWVQVQPDDVFQLFDKLGIVAQLEALQAMGFQAVGAPDPAHRGGADSDRRSHRPRAPMGRVGRFLLCGLVDDLGHCFRRNRRLATGTRGVLFDAGDALLEKPLTPARHRLGHHSHQRGDLLVEFSLGCQQYDLGPLNQSSGRAPTTRITLQLGLLFGRNGDHRGNPHAASPSQG